jgi:hypothetical protein
VALAATFIQFHFPLTLDFAAWYAGTSWLAASLLAMLAIYGCFTATRGQTT